MKNIPAAAIALLTAGDEVIPPIDSMERRIYALEARVIGLTRAVEALIEQQGTVNEEIREGLDRVYRALDTAAEEDLS